MKETHSLWCLSRPPRRRFQTQHFVTFLIQHCRSDNQSRWRYAQWNFCRSCVYERVAIYQTNDVEYLVYDITSPCALYVIFLFGLSVLLISDNFEIPDARRVERIEVLIDFLVFFFVNHFNSECHPWLMDLYVVRWVTMWYSFERVLALILEYTATLFMVFPDELMKCG